MLLPLKPICPSRKARRDGTCLVFIQYCKTGAEKTILNTGIAIPHRFWHKKLRRILDSLPTEYGNPEVLNEEIYRLYGIAEKIITFALKEKIANPVAFVKKHFHPDFDIKSLEAQKPVFTEQINLDFFYQVDDYIRYKQKQVSPKMINVYLNLRNTLKSFESFTGKPITFQAIDYNFYEEFVDYMLHEHTHRRRKEAIKGFKLSTTGRNIKQLRIFLRNRMRKRIIPFIDLSDFKILDEESDAIYLTTEEISRIYDLDLSSKPHLQKYRDLFILGCLTGLRFSDFSQIKPQDIRDGMLYKKQGKSDHWVVVPLRDQANFILNSKFNKQIPSITNPDFNYYIKEVGCLAEINHLITFYHKRDNKDIEDTRPKYAWITSHTCRRSFCTNEFLSGTPAELIMKISGHKNLRDFYRYIRITPEEAGRKIKEIWEKRNEISTPIPHY